MSGKTYRSPPWSKWFPDQELMRAKIRLSKMRPSGALDLERDQLWHWDRGMLDPGSIRFHKRQLKDLSTPWAPLTTKSRSTGPFLQDPVLTRHKREGMRLAWVIRWVPSLKAFLQAKRAKSYQELEHMIPCQFTKVMGRPSSAPVKELASTMFVRLNLSLAHFSISKMLDLFRDLRLISALVLRSKDLIHQSHHFSLLDQVITQSSNLSEMRAWAKLYHKNCARHLRNLVQIKCQDPVLMEATTGKRSQKNLTGESVLQQETTKKKLWGEPVTIHPQTLTTRFTQLLNHKAQYGDSVQAKEELLQLAEMKRHRCRVTIFHLKLLRVRLGIWVWNWRKQVLLTEIKQSGSQDLVTIIQIIRQELNRNRHTRWRVDTVRKRHLMFQGPELTQDLWLTKSQLLNTVLALVHRGCLLRKH